MKKMPYQVAVVVLLVSCFLPSFALAYQPNDPQFAEQSYLEQIEASAGWDIQNRADGIVVAVIDTGVDFANPELIDTSWVNKNEIADNNLDDDNNGYVDDVYGWNFVENDNDVSAHFYSDITRIGVSHGTAVAGIIAAQADNSIGISGLAPGVKIMSLRALTSKGDGDFTSVINAIRYAVNNGAKIINLSMVSSKTNDHFESVVKEAIAKNILVVSATGNETDSTYEHDISINLNSELRFPICSNGGVGVLGVGSVNKFDVKSPFSNYGSGCLDVSAPGENFISTVPFNPLLEEFRTYTNGMFTGTSVSAPLVSATAALMWKLKPSLTAEEIEKIIVSSGDDIDLYNPLFLGQVGARLNVYKALLAVKNFTASEKYVVGTKAGSEPYLYFFSKTGALEKKFLVYDKKFKGGFNFIVADVNNDGREEVVTIAGKSGGPHLRIFNSDGELINQFMAGSSKQTNGSALSLISNGVTNNIVVVNQSSKQPVISIYDWRGKLISSFLADKENKNTDVKVISLKEKIIIINSNAKAVKVYNGQGKKIATWLLPFNQNEIMDYYKINGSEDSFVIQKKDANYVFNSLGDIEKITEPGYLYYSDKQMIIVNRGTDWLSRLDVNGQYKYLNQPVVTNISSLRVMNN